jgi:RimJ/RimL family protein N-acetyltransferase
VIQTDRLILREWRDEDGDSFVAVTNTPEVMEYLGGVEDPAKLKSAVARQQAIQAEHGYCFWVVERRSDRTLMGFCGLKPGPPGTPLFGEVEIGWRLGAAFWGHGYAREAAQASLDWAWANLSVATVAAMTVEGNVRSWGLMERIGMVRVSDGDFDHPDLPDGHPLQRHILYRIGRPVR